jgi:hypothetical protein
MKKAVMFTVFFLVMFIGAAFSQDGMEIKIDNYSITVPSGWLAQRTDSSTVFILYSPIEENDTFQENGNLAVEKLPTQYSVKGYLEAARENIKKIYGNFILIEEGENYQIISGDINGTTVQQIQFVSIKKNMAYILTFTSNPENFNHYLDTFKKIQETFKY